MPPFQYAGDELDVFAHALNWKAYLRSQIAPHLGGDVLEVGAGIGGTLRVFAGAPTARTWTALEPDPGLAARARAAANALKIPWDVIVGTLADLEPARRFDAILYIDVLEHIEDDRGELARAAAHLSPRGALIVMSPAHRWLYTPFDARIGHYRRYSRRRLRHLTPPATTLETLRYLDAAGIVPSAANKLLLRSARATRGQVEIWDRWFVTVSRRIDPWLGWRVGKSILAIWRKT